MQVQIRLFYFLILFFLIAPTSMASAPSELSEFVLTGDLFGHSTKDVRKKARNKEFVIPEGTQGTVLESHRLAKDGSYALKIRIDKPAKDKLAGSPPPGSVTWVYYSQTSPRLTLKDKEENTVNDPEVALSAKALETQYGFEAKDKEIPLPTRLDVLKTQKSMDFSSPPECGPQFCPPLKHKGIELEKIGDQPIQSDILANAAAEEALWSVYPAIYNYSKSQKVADTITYAKRNKESRSHRLCYRYVKRALLGGDLISSYPPGRYARQGISDLKRRGFKNLLEDPTMKALIRNPKDAPKGAVLVYENVRNPRHPGHIEIKTDWGEKGGYVSDFYRNGTNEILNRRLIGVMIQETL